MTEPIRWKFETKGDGAITFVGPDALSAQPRMTQSVPYHEAAHAVVARRLGLRPTLSTVVPEEVFKITRDPRSKGGDG